MALNFPDSPTLNQVYTDTTSGFSYQWDGVVWKSYASAASSQIKILDDISGSFNGSTSVFPITISGTSFAPANAQQLRIVLGGIVQEPIADYVVSGDTIAFTTPPGSGLSFSGVSLGPALPAVGIASTGTVYVRQQYSPTGVQTTFTFTSGYTPGFLDVYHNGSKLVSGDDYTASNGSTFDLTTPAQNGDDVEGIAYLINEIYSTNGILSSLLVSGDARIVGILTVGSSSITLDGSSNTINVGSLILSEGGITGTSATFTGNVSIAGTLTYEDVTNVDSIGLVTARSGINVTGGSVVVGSAVTLSSSGINVVGVVTATSYFGDGSQLTGVGGESDITSCLFV